jgi:hypothetical protein
LTTKQRLPAFNFFGVRPLLLHARDDGAGVVAELHARNCTSLSDRHFLHTLDGADAYVHLVQNVNRDRRFHGHGVIPLIVMRRAR